MKLLPKEEKNKRRASTFSRPKPTDTHLNLIICIVFRCDKPNQRFKATENFKNNFIQRKDMFLSSSAGRFVLIHQFTSVLLKHLFCAIWIKLISNHPSVEKKVFRLNSIFIWKSTQTLWKWLLCFVFAHPMVCTAETKLFWIKKIRTDVRCCLICVFIED